MSNRGVGRDLENIVLNDRRLPRWLSMIISIACVGTAIFYLYTSYVGQYPLYAQIGVLFAVSMALAFLYTPMIKGKTSLRSWVFVVDALFALLSVSIIAYLAYRQLTLPLGIEDPMPKDWEIVAGGILFLLAVEGTRRTAGWPLVILVAFFTAYALFGEKMPEPFKSWNFSVTHIVRYVSLETSGIYGIALLTMAKVLIPFFLLSSLLQIGGAGRFFIDLPFSIVGRFRGGPAKLSVIASSLFGTISGSSSANVVAVGTFTIPLMIKTGYRPHVAGAIEALSSTGGQIMPPVMGIAAFVMAELLGLSYWTIAVAAVIPAVMFYAAVFVQVHLEAVKTGLSGTPKQDLPKFWKVLRSGWYLLLPLILLMVFLGGFRFSPEKGCFFSLLSLLGVSWFKKETKLGPRTIWKAFDSGVRSCAPIAVFCSSIGVIIGLVSLTGFGPQLSQILVDFSSGNTLVLLILTMITALILGMGMSTTPVYLFLALLVGPALVKMGIPLLSAHMFIFYYGCLSVITPPVALATYAAAPIAKANPWAIGWVATRMGLIAYVMPFFFVFNPALLMRGTLLEIGLTLVSTFLAALCLGVASVGGFVYPIRAYERALWGVAGFLLFFRQWYTLLIVGLLLLVCLLSQYYRHKHRISSASRAWTSPPSKPSPLEEERGGGD